MSILQEGETEAPCKSPALHPLPGAVLVLLSLGDKDINKYTFKGLRLDTPSSVLEQPQDHTITTGKPVPTPGPQPPALRPVLPVPGVSQAGAPGHTRELPRGQRTRAPSTPRTQGFNPAATETQIWPIFDSLLINPLATPVSMAKSGEPPRGCWALP